MNDSCGTKIDSIEGIKLVMQYGEAKYANTCTSTLRDLVNKRKPSYIDYYFNNINLYQAPVSSGLLTGELIWKDKDICHLGSLL